MLGFVGDRIFDNCGKVGCHMKFLFIFCAWLHGHVVNLECRKIMGVFWGDCWNIFGIQASCWVLMDIYLYDSLG